MSTGSVTRRQIAAVMSLGVPGSALGLAPGSSTRAQTPLVGAIPLVAIPRNEVAESTARARGGRLAMDVDVDGRGPFRFVMDSAANASVIAGDLALELGLPAAGRIAMNTLIAREIVETVRAGRLRCGVLDVEQPRLVLASRLGLNGADGLIGLDLLKDFRLVMNFRGGGCFRISRSRRVGGSILDGPSQAARFQAAADGRFAGFVSVAGRSRTTPFTAIIDTGAEVSIINLPLAVASRALPARLNDGARTQTVRSPTGMAGQGLPMIVPQFGFAGVSVQNVPVIAGDFHTFNVWGVSGQPAALIGVDLLGLFETAIIDLKRGELVLNT